MLCIKCQNEINADALYCCFCGRKQELRNSRCRCKRPHGTGTISIDRRYKNQFIAHAPSDSKGRGRIYLGAFPDRDAAQKALAEYIKRGRPDLFKATLRDIYGMWSQTHYRRISQKTADGYRSNWKHFEPIADMKMSEISTVHFQSIVNAHAGAGVSRGIKVLAGYLCRFAMENNILDRNYADFIKLPKTEKTEKVIFSAKQISELWKHSGNRNVQAILVMIYMGFRIGEITSLTADSVRLDKGYIVSGVKTEAGKNRLIPFPAQIPEIKGFVEEWLKKAEPGGRLFPFTEHSFRSRVFYDTIIKLGMLDAHIDRSGKVVFHNKHHLTPHSTRHTFATLSVAAGMQPERLQKIIGHASYRTTADYYVHIDTDALIAEMGKLSKCM